MKGSLNFYKGEKENEIKACIIRVDGSSLNR